MGGQIIDATIVAAQKQRNTDGEKRTIMEGGVPEDKLTKLVGVSRAPGPLDTSSAVPIRDRASRVLGRY